MMNTPYLATLPASQDAGCARLLTVAAPASCESRQPVRILRLPEVINRVGLKRAAIYLYVKQGQFPKQVNLGLRAVGWIEHEIDAWVAARIEVTRRER
jgi:prophage regulatory protein